MQQKRDHPEIKVLESRLAYLKNKQAQAKAFLSALSLSDFDEPTMDNLLDLSKAYHHVNDQHNAEAVCTMLPNEPNKNTVMIRLYRRYQTAVQTTKIN